MKRLMVIMICACLVSGCETIKQNKAAAITAGVLGTAIVLLLVQNASQADDINSLQRNNAELRDDICRNFLRDLMRSGFSDSDLEILPSYCN